MKKLLIFAISVVMICSSCKKEQIEVLVPAPTDYIQIDSVRLPGYKIAHPIDVFDQKALWYSCGTQIDSGLVNQLQGQKLPNDGPRWVYVLRLGNFGGTLANVQYEAERKGLKLAPLSYLLAFARDYGVAGWSNNTYYFNLVSVTLPKKIDFGLGGQEAGLFLAGPTYDPSTGTVNSNFSLSPFPLTTIWYGVDVLVYK